MCRTGGEAVAAAAQTPQFPPSFLLGALYGFWNGDIRFVRASPRDRAVAGVASSSQEAVGRFFRSEGNGDGGGDLEGYEPISSRGGLVVLRCARESDGGGLRPLPGRKAPSDLCVCDPVADRRLFLPRPGIHDESHVLLFAAAGGCGGHHPQMIMHVVNLELLRHKVLQVQTFSPETNAWGPVVATYAHLPPSSFIRPAPLVVGAVAYWLCVSNAAELGCYVLALCLDGSSPPEQIELPPRSQLGRVAKPSVEMLLVSSLDGWLGLAVARYHEISIWTLSSSPSKDGSARWTRRAVVNMARVVMAESAAPEELPPLTTDEEVRLECFAERSSALLFRLYHGCLFELSLATMEVRFIGYYSKRDSLSMCAYDMDPASINQRSPTHS